MRRLSLSLGFINLSLMGRAWNVALPRRPRSEPSVRLKPSQIHSRSPYWSADEEEVEYEDLYNGGDSQQFATFSDEPELLEWETCETDAGTAHVLLPPSTVRLPKVVFHFTGGTFFGSAPTFWYRKLLVDLVRHTQAAIVATSIPLTLTRSPLQHVELSKKIREQFQVAYRDILGDEYGEEISDVPVCGLGHSLGARLMVVLSTLGKGTTSRKPSARTLPPPPYQAFILISFTNNNAVDGIPGLTQLARLSRRSEKEQRTQTRRSRRRREYAGDESDDEEEDDEYGDINSELFRELQSLFVEQAKRIKNVLTPASEELEFYPTPEELWEALTEGGRYNIPKTLVVQFDNDQVDQSSKLAAAIVDSSDVKYARLRGTHLTPLSLRSNSSEENSQLNSQAGILIDKLLAASSLKESNEEYFTALRQSISRYVTEIVTKEDAEAEE